MKKSIIAIAFMVASVPMFAANQASQANPPANAPAGTTEAKPAVKTKKHVKKNSKKVTPKKDTTTTAPVAK
jgi:hypothetical protein